MGTVQILMLRPTNLTLKIVILKQLTFAKEIYNNLVQFSFLLILTLEPKTK
jgi:hypothetical protein